MITFKAFLSEARMAPLYHYTTPANFNKIATTNVMIAKTQTGHKLALLNDKKAVFFTRDLKVARWHGAFDRSFIVLQFDQQKLAHRYKIKPVFNWSKYKEEQDSRKSWDYNPHGTPIYMNPNQGIGSPEFEEIIEKDITDPFKYVTTIYINNKRNETLKKILSQYPSIEVKSIEAL